MSQGGAERLRVAAGPGIEVGLGVASGLRVAVFGAAGKMGQRVVAALREAGLDLHAAIDRASSPALGVDAGVLAGGSALGVVITADLQAARGADVAIDFTEPSASLDNADACAFLGLPIVVATTGHNAEQKVHLAAVGAKIPMVFAPNMSVGMNMLFAVLPMIAQTLGEEYDIEVLESHHRHKKDAPSGTAHRLGELLASAMGWPYDDVARYERHGLIGDRPRREIGMQTLRVGDVVGDHTVTFGTVGERVEITHRASSRDTFAKGAVRAAAWLHGKPAGQYDMQDVLGLRGVAHSFGPAT